MSMFAGADDTVPLQQKGTLGKHELGQEPARQPDPILSQYSAVSIKQMRATCEAIWWVPAVQSGECYVFDLPGPD